MKIRRQQIVYFLFFVWSISSIIVPIIDSIVVARIWQLSIVSILGLTGGSLIFQTNIIESTIIKIVLGWGVYVLFQNFVVFGNAKFDHLDTFIDVSWWISIYILFYSVYVRDFDDKYFNLLIRIYPYFFLLVYGLITYRMIFNSGGIKSDIIETDDINSVYWMLVLVPFAYLLENRILRNAILFSSFILVLASSKRVAAIAMSLIIMISIFRDSFEKKSVLKRILFAVVLFSGFVLVFNWSLAFFDVSVLDRLGEVEIGDESRVFLYVDTWERFESKELIFQIFGSGHRSTAIDRGSDMLSKTAHNDFLEVLYDYGTVGLIIYLYFVWKILMRLANLYRVGGKFFHAYLAAFIIFLSMSMASHLIIYPTYFTFLVLLWALIEARYSNHRRWIYSPESRGR
jgi:hypothetical protein